MQYPILHTGCIPNPAFTIVPVIDSTMTIDENPVITSFTWTNNETGATGTVLGNSTSLFANNLPVVIINPMVASYYTPLMPITALSD